MNDSPQTDPGKDQPVTHGFRVRWSLRVLIGVITLACVVFGWVSLRLQLGRVHQDVGERLVSIYEEQQKEFAFGKPVRMDVRWSLEKMVKVSRQGRTLFEVSTEPSDWMKWTNTELAFQRIQEIRLVRMPRGERLDETIQQIRRLKRVNSLEFEEVYLTKSQLDGILSDVKLRSLEINNTPMILSDMPALRETSLERLSFADTCFTNLGVDSLPESLVDLNLSGTSITDASLEKLPRLKNLIFLSLANTRTSEDAVDELRRKMPRCEVAWDRHSVRVKR